MPGSWLLGNLDTSHFSADVDSPVDFNQGLGFTASVDAVADQVRWYRATTDVDQAPVNLEIWDMETGVVLWTAPAVPDSGAIGWQACDVVDPIAVTAGRHYCLTAWWQTHRQQARSNADFAFQPPSFPGQLWQPPYHYRAFADEVPNEYSGNAIVGYDVHLTAQTPTTAWEVVASTPYTETLKWHQPADFYRLSVTTIGQWKTANVVEGIDVRRLVGFWSPVRDDFVGKRYYIDSPTSELHPDNGQRMEGLLLNTGPGSAGTVEAWVASGA